MAFALPYDLCIVVLVVDLQEQPKRLKKDKTSDMELLTLNRFIEATDREVLQEKYRIVQDRLFESDFDRAIKQLESGGKPELNEE